MRFVIVGGGVAGVTAAMDLARRGAADPDGSAGNPDSSPGKILVFTDEDYPYYYRPQLTEFLAGDLPLHRLLRRPLSWYLDRGIQLQVGRSVTAIHLDRKTITVEGTQEVNYDKLLLAMGSLPFVPPIKGADKAGIHTWRTLDDTLSMVKMASACQNVLVIGGGLLGLEAARGLSGFCNSITVLEFFPRLMPRQLDPDGAGLLQSFVESLGIDVVVGARCEEFLGEDRVTGVRLEDGRVLPASSVLVAAGVRPNDRLAADAGIEVNRGVVVDHRMATSAPDVYAAGDVAVYEGYSWAIAPIAQAQARVAVANMVGEETRYDVVVPSTTLKVVGIDVSSVGFVHPEDDTVVEVRTLDREAGVYKKIVLRDDVIVGSIVINDRPLARHLETQIANEARLTVAEAEKLLG